MHRFAPSLCLWLLLASSAFAQNALEMRYIPGEDVCVQLSNGSTYDMTVGGTARDRVLAAATLSGASLPAGWYTAEAFASTAANYSAADATEVSVWYWPAFYWDGTAVVRPDAKNAATLLATATSDAGAGTIGRLWHYALAGYSASGELTAGMFANQPSLELTPEQLASLSDDIRESLEQQGIVVTPIAATTILDGRTWTPDALNSSRAGNIVTVKAPFEKTLKVEMPLNPGADIDSVTSVTVIGPTVDEETIEIATTNLRKSADGRSVLFDLEEALTVAGNYTVTARVETLDSQDISMECRLIAR